MQNNSNVCGVDPYTYPIEKLLITMALLHLSIPQIQQYNNVIIYSSNVPWQH
jgi:hypothetical protein